MSLYFWASLSSFLAFEFAKATKGVLCKERLCPSIMLTLSFEFLMEVRSNSVWKLDEISTPTNLIFHYVSGKPNDVNGWQNTVTFSYLSTQKQSQKRSSWICECLGCCRYITQEIKFRFWNDFTTRQEKQSKILIMTETMTTVKW